MCCQAKAIECKDCTHKGLRNWFKETCPRVDELLFRGGNKSATQIIEETRKNGCQHFTLKGGVVQDLSHVDLGEMVKEIDRRGMVCRIREKPKGDTP